MRQFFWTGFVLTLATALMTHPSPAKASDPPVCAGDTTWARIESANHKVWVWWRKDGDTAKYPGDPHKAKIIADAIDKSWSKLTDLMKKEPLSDDGESGCHGADGRLDIYLVEEWSRKVGGVTRAYPRLWECKELPAYTLIKNTYDDPHVGTNELEATTAHELMHAIIFAYPSRACVDGEYLWLNEATATWAEDFAYTYNTEHNLAHELLDEPHVPLDTPDGVKGRGRYLLPFYLSRYSAKNPDIIRRIWEATEQYADSLEAVDSVIDGGFKDRWSEFVRFNWNRPPMNQYFNDDKLMPGANVTLLLGVTLGGSPDREFRLLENVDLPHLTARYYHFKFVDDAVRTVAFYNGLTFNLCRGFNCLPGGDIDFSVRWQPVPPKGGNVQALVKVGGKWEEWDQEKHDWTDVPYKIFCRDRATERIEELVLIFSNSQYKDRNAVLKPEGDPPTLWVSNMGCWRWKGWAKRTYYGGNEGTTARTAKLTWTRVKDHVMGALESAPVDLGDVGFVFAPSVYYAPTESGVEWEVSGTWEECTFSGGMSAPVKSNRYTYFYTSNYVPDGTYHRWVWGLGANLEEATTTKRCPGRTDSWTEPIGLWFHLDKDIFVEPDGTLIQGKYGDAGEVFEWCFKALREGEEEDDRCSLPGR